MTQIEERITNKNAEDVMASRMFANILVATDFSPASDQALEYALSFARTYDAKLFLLHVLVLDNLTAREMGASLREKLYRDAHEKMGRILALGRFVGVPHETIVEEGSLWPVINAQIEKYGIDLVVLGTHGAGVVKKALLGSSAEQVFRQARVPVLTVGPKILHEPLYGIELKNILLATELNNESKRKVQYAFSLAQEHRSKLNLLHVVPQLDPDAKSEAITDRMRHFLPHTEEMHCLPIYRVEQGEPAEEILRIANEIQADLIVLGAKPRSLLADYLPRTIAYQVACGAPCPVLTIHS